MTKRDPIDLLAGQRRKLGITQKQAASALKISQASLSKIENHIVPASIDLVQSYADLVGMEVSLLPIKDPKKQNKVYELRLLIRSF